MTNSLTYTRLLIAVFMLAMRGFVWGGTITDVLNVEIVGSRTSYGDWSVKSSRSTAVYAGYSTGKSSIQLQAINKKKSSIITTISGGKAVRISVNFYTGTTKGNGITIYGKNTAYKSAEDLYDTNKKGTKIGSILCNKTTETAELTITGNYEYIGICAGGDYSINLSDISIEWEDDSYQDTADKTATTTSFPQSAYKVFWGDSFTAPQASVSIGDATVTYSSSNESVATVDAATGEVTLKAAGTTTITAFYAGDETYSESSASYTLTVQNTRNFVWDATTIYTENTTLGIVTDGISPVTFTFAKNDADHSPAYYAEGNFIQTSYKNTIKTTVPEGYLITGIQIAYIFGYGYAFTSNKGSFSVENLIGNWTGLSSSVTLKSTAGARFTTITVSYTKLSEVGTTTVSAAGVATFCPETSVIVGDGTHSSIVTGVDNTGMLIQEDIEMIPAGTGVMLFGAGSYTLYSCANLDIPSPVTNWLVGVTTDTPAIVDTHVLQNGEDGIAFYHVKTAGITTVTAGKAYLKLDGAAQAKTIRIFDEKESTGIGAVQETNKIQSIHAINGIRISQPVKGINIILLENGKTIKFIKP